MARNGHVPSRGPAARADIETASVPAYAAGGPVDAADAIVALRVVGTEHTLHLPVDGPFRIGTADAAEVRIATAVAPHVSRVHAQVIREGDASGRWLRVTDLQSKNGITFQGARQQTVAVSAGQRFTLGTTELLVIDRVLAGLRATLAEFLGFSAHAQLDDELDLVPRQPVLLIGDRNSERRQLATGLHGFSRRRRRRLLDVTDPQQRREALTTLIADARGGTVFATLDGLGQRASMAHFVSVVFDRSLDVWPILAARSLSEARGVLDTATQLMRPLVIPSIASRRGDVPTLLEMMLLARNCPHRVGELGAAQIAAMKAYDWPRDRVELRETAARVDALLVHGGNLAAASAAIGQDYETYRRALARVGAITVRRRT